MFIYLVPSDLTLNFKRSQIYTPEKKHNTFEIWWYIYYI